MTVNWKSLASQICAIGKLKISSVANLCDGKVKISSLQNLCDSKLKIYSITNKNVKLKISSITNIKLICGSVSELKMLHSVVGKLKKSSVTQQCYDLGATVTWLSISRALRRCEIEKYSSVPTWPVKMFARSQKYRIFGYSNIEFINKSAKTLNNFSLSKERRFRVQIVL